jgi:hypothetical protein
MPKMADVNAQRRSLYPLHATPVTVSTARCGQPGAGERAKIWHKIIALIDVIQVVLSETILFSDTFSGLPSHRAELSV